ncbi:hypothetical protein [Acinetobacter sp. WCHAc060025]|uniref:hypothetical protein n=1 Tax=Acinetobacter sp. WCHAc060025 TaxID=2518625 RepID=UPI0013EECCFF|nr:hypothetical protein [Acinetobacter sp. WCHAc060025]
MKNQAKPDDAGYVESDGTYWKCEKGQWKFWRKGWGWCRYVGIVNQKFLDKFIQL